MSESLILYRHQMKEVALPRHRLALGLRLVDGVRQTTAYGPLRATLESLGPYTLNLPMDAHGPANHALRYAGTVRRYFDHAIETGQSTQFTVRIDGGSVRTYVPRRLRFDLAIVDEEPAATAANMREVWLWPGAAYPLPAVQSGLRGRLRRGANLQDSVPIQWARIVAAVPSDEANFAAATVVARGMSDDRGDFSLALDTNAVGGAALSPSAAVRLWVFLPGAQPPSDDLYAHLPLEDAGLATINDVLRGFQAPAGYSAATDNSAVNALSPFVLDLTLGQMLSSPQTTFLFN